MLKSFFSNDMKGKVVWITGASSGIGEALAHSFYLRESNIILSARRVDELNRVKEEVIKKYPHVQAEKPLIVPMDLGEISTIQECVNKVYGVYDHIDILINNGGVSHRADILSTSIEVDLKIMYVNYFGTVALTKAVLPNMVRRKSGHIVFVSSVQGLIAIPDRSAYGASKHAMQAFADSLRAEMAVYNINVSILSPGYVKTAVSLNALTGNGEKHGVMDTTTANGYEPAYVAERTVSMISKKQNELVLCTFSIKLGIFLRFMLPSIYFWYMSRRANNRNKQ